jgi:hypothetical protein
MVESKKKYHAGTKVKYHLHLVGIVKNYYSALLIMCESI